MNINSVDEDEREFEEKVRVIRDCLSRGISLEQIVHIHPELGLSKSTIYGWIDRGYAGMGSMDLRRKVSYEPRHRSLPRRPAKHSPRTSHDGFPRLPGDVRESAWEMDTVEGRRRTPNARSRSTTGPPASSCRFPSGTRPPPRSSMASASSGMPWGSRRL